MLSPERYVGAAEVEEDAEPFEKKIKRLIDVLDSQFKENEELQQAIRQNLGRIEYGE